LSSEVDLFLEGLQHTRKDEITLLYSRIRGEFKILEAEIKWNAPSFKLNGSNVVTFRLFPEPVFQIILHLGAKKLAASKNLEFEVVELNHRWADSTRCVITVDDDFDWQPLEKAINKWLKLVA
jgi:hypothetical protein